MRLRNDLPIGEIKCAELEQPLDKRHRRTITRTPAQLAQVEDAQALQLPKMEEKILPLQEEEKMNKRLILELFGKTLFLWTVGIYLLAVPFLFIINGPLDALLPYEAVLCLALSGASIGWSLKTCERLVKT